MPARPHLVFPAESLEEQGALRLALLLLTELAVSRRCWVALAVAAGLTDQDLTEWTVQTVALAAAAAAAELHQIMVLTLGKVEMEEKDMLT